MDTPGRVFRPAGGHTSMAAPPAQHAKWPPFFQAEVVEPPQSIFHPSHWLPSRESIADPRNQSRNRSARCVNMTALAGGEVERGVSRAPPFVAHPLPNPPPQGGRQ